VFLDLSLLKMRNWDPQGIRKCSCKRRHRKRASLRNQWIIWYHEWIIIASISQPEIYSLRKWQVHKHFHSLSQRGVT